MGYTVQWGDGQMKESGRAPRTYHHRPDLLGCPRGAAYQRFHCTIAWLHERWRQSLAYVGKDRCSRACAHANKSITVEDGLSKMA